MISLSVRFRNMALAIQSLSFHCVFSKFNEIDQLKLSLPLYLKVLLWEPSYIFCLKRKMKRVGEKITSSFADCLFLYKTSYCQYNNASNMIMCRFQDRLVNFTFFKTRNRVGFFFSHNNNQQLLHQ